MELSSDEVLETMLAGDGAMPEPVEVQVDGSAGSDTEEDKPWPQRMNDTALTTTQMALVPAEEFLPDFCPQSDCAPSHDGDGVVTLTYTYIDMMKHAYASDVCTRDTALSVPLYMLLKFQI